MTEPENLFWKWRQKIKEQMPTGRFATLSAAEAKKLGIDLEPDWQVKVDLTQDADIARLTYVSPEKVELSNFIYDKEGRPTDYLVTMPDGSVYRKEDMEAGRVLKPTIPGAPPRIVEPALTDTQEALLRVFPDALRVVEGDRTRAINNLITGIDRDTEGFISKLKAKGRTPDVEMLLKALGVGWDEVEAETQAPISQRAPELAAQFQRALPRLVKPASVDKMMTYFFENPDSIKSALIDAGRNTETEALVKLLYPDITSTQMKNYFSIRASVVQQRAEDRLGVTKGFWGDLGDQFVAGAGDILTLIGGASKWLGKEGAGETISQAGQYMQAYTAPDEFGEFKWEQLLNPKWAATRLTRMAPNLMLLAIPGLGGASLGASVAARTGFTIMGKAAFGKAVLQGIGGAALSRPVESAMEAAGAYDMAIAKGLSDAEAEQAAWRTFKGNMTLAGQDAIQFAVAFMPTPFRVGAGLISKGLVTTAKIGGKVIFTGLTEGGEEVYQQILQKQALGEEIDWSDPEIKEVFALGAMAGVGFGGGVDILTKLQGGFISRLNPEQLKGFNDDKANLTGQGLSDVAATEKALDNIVEANPELVKVVEEVVKKVQTETLLQQVEPKDAVDKVVWEQQKAKIAEEAGIPVPEAKKAPRPTVERPVAAPEKVVPEVTVVGITDANAIANIENTVRNFPLRIEKGVIFVRISPMEKHFERFPNENAFYDRDAQEIILRNTQVALDKTNLEHELTHIWIDEKILSEGSNFLADYAEVSGMKGYVDAIRRSFTKDVETTSQSWLSVYEGLARDFVTFMEHPDKLDSKMLSFFNKITSEKVAIPKAEVGMPEAGYQPTMIEEVPERVVRPKPKGRITQISMEEQLKLEEARRAAEEERPFTEAEQLTYEAEREAMEAKGRAEYLLTDPVATFRFQMGTKIVGKGETRKVIPNMVGLESLISIREQAFPDYFTVKQAQALNPGSAFAKYTEKGTKYYNKVPRDEALDEIAEKLGYPVESQTETTLGDRVEQIRKERARIRDLERVEAPAEVPPEVPTPPPPQAIIAPEPAPLVPTGEEITRIIAQSEEQVRQSAPAALKRAMLHLPGLKQMFEFERPGFKMTGKNQKVAVAIIAENAARADVATMSVGTRILALNELRKVFGLDVLHGAKSDIKFLGTAEQAKSLLTGTLLDIVQNPELYELNQRQLGAVSVIQTHTDRMLEWVNQQYNAEIGRWTPKENGAYLPNVDVSEDVVEYLGNEMRAVVSGRGKTRVWATSRERLAGKTPFKPELDVQKLTEGTDAFKSAVAGAQSYRTALGGLTRLEAMEKTHPELYNKMMALRKELTSLQGSAGTIESNVHKAIYKFLNSPVEDMDLAEVRDSLDVKLKRGPRVGFDVVAVQDQIARVREEIKQIRPSWEAANLKPYVLIQEGLWRYFPMEQAVLIKESRLISRNPMLFSIEMWRGGAFSGDLSPFSIQGLLGVLGNPWGVLKASVGAAKAAYEHHDLLRSVRVSALAEDVGNNPMEYGLYASLLGRQLTGTPTEYAAGWLSKLPRIGKFFGRATETSYVIVTRGSFYLWKQEYQHLMKTGVPEVEAQVAAIEMANKIYPMVNPKLLGQSEARTAFLRAMPTSYSFIRQPAALIEQAVQGFAKIMIGKKLSPQEGMAIRLVTTGAASTLIISATSAAISALARGEDEDDVRKAIWDAINPDPMNGKFASIIIGAKRIPLGGPYRAIFRALYPQEVKGIPFPVPFAGLFGFRGYLYNRLSPAIRTQIDLFARNKEYAGTQIRTGKPIEGFLRALWYEFEGALPLTAGEISEALRRGERYTENIWQQVISQFMGVNMVTLDNTYLDRQGRQLGLELVGEAKPFSIQKPNIYRTTNLWSDTIRVIKDRDLHDIEVREDNKRTIDIAQVREIKREVDTLRNSKAISINADVSKGDTYIEFNEQWLERQKIKGEEALAEFDKKYPNAELGNLSQREMVLLREFHSITDKKKQADFLKQHPELSAIPRLDWLKSHPIENARLAIYGQADILTKEAYTEFKQRIKGLDYPDSALPERVLPPEGSIDTHFKYLDMVVEGTHGSWEADLLLRKDAEAAKKAGLQPYAEWKGLKLDDRQIEALELRVKNHKLYDLERDFAIKDSLDYKDNTIKDKDGLTARDRAMKQLVKDNPDWVDDKRRVAAMEKGTEKAPIDPKIVDAHVDYMKMQDAPGVGPGSASVELAKIDQSGLTPKLNAYGQWRLDNKLDKELPDFSRVPIWNIDVKYAKEDAAYRAILDKNEGKEESEATKAYLAGNEAYRKDRRRREAYQKGLTGHIENYVSYYELPVIGYRQERFLFNNPGFAQAIGLKVPERVPSEEYDVLLEKPNKPPEDLLRMGAYKLYVPDKHIENYVGYYSLVKPANYEDINKTTLWFEDEWFMIDHPDFYRQVYRTLLEKQEIDFSKVPTREVFAKYLEYVWLASDTQRGNYRMNNPDLDEWGVMRFGWKPIAEQKRRAAMTPAEQRAEDFAKKQREIEESLAKLKK